MKTFGKVAMLWFVLCALGTGFAWAGLLDSMQPVTVEVTVPSDNKSPAKRLSLQWPVMTREQAFYYWVAVYGAPADLVDRYARVFDADNYRRAMADEFERSRYRGSVESRIMTHVRELTFNEKFTYVNNVSLGEYSFTNHAFPLFKPDTGFSYFNYWVAGNGFDINPFDLGMALNTTDFTWSVPMTEVAGSALVKSRPGRTLTARIVYSVTREKNDVYSSRYYLTPFIHKIEVFADPNMTKLVGTLSRAASAPRDPQEWALKEAEAARLLIGTWRDENSVITYSADGTRFVQWDNGTTRKHRWSLRRGIIQGETIEMNGEPRYGGGAGGFKTRIISITPSTLVTMESDGKTWHSTRTADATVPPSGSPVRNDTLTERTSSVTAPAPATTEPASLEKFSKAIERDDKAVFKVKCNYAAPGYVFLRDGVLTLSKTDIKLSLPIGTVDYGFTVSSDKILEVTQQPQHVRLRVAEMTYDRKEVKRNYDLYNISAVTVGVGSDGRILSYGTANIVCDECDDTMSVLYALLEKIREGNK